MIGPAALALIGAIHNPFSGLHLPSFHSHADVQTSRYGLQGWRIDVRHDRFAGRTRCVIHRGDVSSEHGVVAFHFHHWIDTANAEFRIDGQQAQPVGTVVVEVAGLGERLETSNITNPSGGKVALPLRLVEGARVVSIRPNARSNHRDFDLKGFGAAVAAARVQGCDLGSPASAST